MNLDGLDTEAQEDVVDTKISIVDAMILNFEQRVVNAFEEFNRNNGERGSRMIRSMGWRKYND